MREESAPGDSALRPVSPSQTIGPFFHDVVALTGSDRVTAGEPGGEPIRIEGGVLDGAGDPVDDALVEIWQPEAASTRQAGTAGFARSETADAGRFSFEAIKPRSSDDDAAPFVLVRLFARGLLRSLVTRIYFADESNAGDPLLQSIAPERRRTLIAERDESTDPPTYRFDIHLQGDDETVFFELQHDPS